MQKQQSQPTERRLIPQLLIPFSLVDQNTKLNLIPEQVASGIYRIKTSEDIDLDVGMKRQYRTGIILNMSKFIDMSPCYGIPEGVQTSVFPRVSLHIRLSSIFDVLVNRGLRVLGPEVLSSEMLDNKELLIYVECIGKEPVRMKAGDEIAELTIEVSPLSIMSLYYPMENSDE